MIFLITYIALMFVAYYLTLPNLFERLGIEKSKAYIPVYRIWLLLERIESKKWWTVLLLFPGINVYMYIIFTVDTLRYFGKFDAKNTIIAILFPPAALFMLTTKYKDDKVFGLMDWSDDKQVAARKWSDILCCLIPTLGLGIIFLAFGNKRNKKGRTMLYGMSEAIVFAFIAATLVRAYVFEPYKIPTGSMEKTMRIGDVLFVNKLALGPRIPNTPFYIPLFHNTVPKYNIKSYVEGIKLPFMRVPGYTSLERNDPFVFNFPAGDTAIFDIDTPPAQSLMGHNYYGVLNQGAVTKFVSKYGFNLNKWNDLKHKYIDKERKKLIDDYGLVYRPVDRRENYVKRCVAMPGDKLEIIDNILYINDEVAFQPEEMMFRYVQENGKPLSLSKKMWNDYNLNKDEHAFGAPITLTESQVKDYERKRKVKLKAINNSKPENGLQSGLNIFPNDPKYNWTVSNFGPITMPKEGSTVELNDSTIALYRRIIDVFENHDLEEKEDGIYIDGEKVTEYTFGQHYYWAMGDNRHNSSDSRMFGFVPHDHIVTTVAFIWFSSGYDGFRSDRLFKGID
jgi:signal peptidase I